MNQEMDPGVDHSILRSVGCKFDHSEMPRYLQSLRNALQPVGYTLVSLETCYIAIENGSW
jgi:hypothetical protein